MATDSLLTTAFIPEITPTGNQPNATYVILGGASERGPEPRNLTPEEWDQIARTIEEFEQITD